MSKSDLDTVIDEMFAASTEGAAAIVITREMKDTFIRKNMDTINKAVREKRAGKINGVPGLPAGDICIGSGAFSTVLSLPNAAQRKEQSERNSHKRVMADIATINGKISEAAEGGRTWITLRSDHFYHKDTVACFTRLGFTYDGASIKWGK